MDKQIITEGLTDNPFFWYAYISWFRAYDDKNELNIDEALEVLDIDKDEAYNWEKDFFPETQEDGDARFIRGELADHISFHIGFQQYEIVFFINDLYIGNLGGHFEAWFLTWEELLALSKKEDLFLLLLPMTGIEAHQTDEATSFIIHQLKRIPKFEQKADYIAACIVNGLKINGQYFNQEGIGLVNTQNHSVRNIEVYPRHKEEVIQLNDILRNLVAQQ